MLLPYLSILNNKKIILGSQSKSRNQLFKIQQIKYQKISSKFAQDLDKQSFASPQEYNLETCRGKVKDLLERFQSQKKQWDMLICGDTIVALQGKIIQKPIDAKDCVDMMSSLSNKSHFAYTAHIIVINTQPKIRYQWVSKAQVIFGQISKQALEQYAKTPQPYIHSGGYELSAVSGSFIKQVRGSHTVVQGLDMYEVCRRIIQGAKQAKWI